MLLKFSKYQGTGNDFIVIDNREGGFDLQNIALVKKLCDRRFGIGADGLMLLQDKKGFDFEMVYFNRDGSQSLCGNGSRCITDFAKRLGIIKEKAHFTTTDGPHDARFDGEWVSLAMSDVKDIEEIGADLFIHTGSPHYIKMVTELEAYDVVKEGRRIRQSPRFAKEGTNVNFIEVRSEKGKNILYVRTYERGVENETLSCGTGVTACALAAHHLGMATASDHCMVHTPGGDLRVRFKKTESLYTDIRLEGPATFVFEGTIDTSL